MENPNLAGSTASTSVIDLTTVLSLLSTVLILGTAYFASLRLLPANTDLKVRILFVWHAFDALIHFILEGGYLYNCFFSFTTGEGLASAYLPPGVFFLGRNDRLYGSTYGTNPLAALWREYAKADARWGGSDVGVISLELLTVFIDGPLAVWICGCLAQQRVEAWFWMIVLATAELYGGWMTFAPEWLTGSPNLETENWLLLWVYLVFFNTLWVWLPLWALWESYNRIVGAMKQQRIRDEGKKER